jgi:hypothetical protein
MVNGLYRMALYAKRDIPAGEELGYDYNFALFDHTQGQECKCSKPNCRGVIGVKSQTRLANGLNGVSPEKKVRQKAVAPKAFYVPKTIVGSEREVVKKWRIFLFRNYNKTRRVREFMNLVNLGNPDPNGTATKDTSGDHGNRE